VAAAAQEIPRLVVRMRGPDLADVRTAAHTLKSNAAMLGAADLAELCRAVEVGHLEEVGAVEAAATAVLRELTAGESVG